MRCCRGCDFCKTCAWTSQESALEASAWPTKHAQILEAVLGVEARKCCSFLHHNLRNHLLSRSSQSDCDCSKSIRQAEAQSAKAAHPNGSVKLCLEGDWKVSLAVKRTYLCSPSSSLLTTISIAPAPTHVDTSHLLPLSITSFCLLLSQQHYDNLQLVTNCSQSHPIFSHAPRSCTPCYPPHAETPKRGLLTLPSTWINHHLLSLLNTLQDILPPPPPLLSWNLRLTTHLPIASDTLTATTLSYPLTPLLLQHISARTPHRE